MKNILKGLVSNDFLSIAKAISLAKNISLFGFNSNDLGNGE